MRRLSGLVALLFAALFLAGCSLAHTTPQEVAIRYSGSNITSGPEVFQKCYTPGENEHGNAGDKVYYYPAGQRTLAFESVVDQNGREVQAPGADSPAIEVTAKGAITLTVSGVITFTPQFQDCTTLQKFHEQIGLKYGAYLKGEDDTTTEVVEGAEGWNAMLQTYVKAPMQRAITNASLNYDAFALSADAASKSAWEAAALTDIPVEMQKQSGGEFFHVDSVLLQAPRLPQAMIDGQIGKQTAQQQADAAAIAAQAAKACDATCQAYQQSQAMNDAIRGGKVQVLPIPYGSPVIANPIPR